MLTCRVDVGSRGVSNHHTASGGGFNVYIVKANSSATNDLQLRAASKPRHQRWWRSAPAARLHRPRLSATLGGWVINPAHLYGISQRINGGLRQLIGNEDYWTGVLAHE